MKRILVVDNAEEVTKLAADLIRQFMGEYDSSVVHSGSAALLFMDDTPVDVVLSAYRMPGGISGLDLVKQMRNEEKLKHIRFVLMSSDPPALLEVFQKKFNFEFLEKPFNITEFCEVLR